MLLKLVSGPHVFRQVRQAILLADGNDVGCRKKESRHCIVHKALPLLPMAGYVRVVVVGAQDIPSLLYHVFLHQTLGYC